MKSDNLKPVSPDKLDKMDSWQRLGDVAFKLAAKAALKQKQKANKMEAKSMCSQLRESPDMLPDFKDNGTPINALQWLIFVMSPDDKSLPFVANCLEHVLEYGRLKKEQSWVCSEIFKSVRREFNSEKTGQNCTENTTATVIKFPKKEIKNEQ